MDRKNTESVFSFLMFTDLVGSAEFKRRLGDSAAVRMIDKHDRLFRECLARYDGMEEADVGDGFLARFDRPTDALRCALAFQKGLAALEIDDRLHARVGIHMGEITRIAHYDTGEGRVKLVGLAVDTTSRVMDLALPDQILMTVGTFNSARQQMVKGPDDTEIVWMAHGPYLFKGLEESTDIYEVGIPGLSPLQAPSDSPKARSATRIGDEITLGWRPGIGIEIPRRENWVLERSLGEGGFGEIWLAHHKQSKTRRVFKFCFDADKLRGLKREVTVFRLIKETLGHRDDITELLDWSFDEAPYFIESEYTEGGDLGEWAGRQGGLETVPLETRLELVAQTATALHAAHSVGVIHKDIKAANVLISRDVEGNPRAVLTDFGIGAITDQRLLVAKGITAAGMTELAPDKRDTYTTSGTRLYMAPELLEGKPVTTAADIYALGVLLYQVVCGQLARALAPGWERDVEDELLREDIAACVEGNPERRLPSAAELATRLRTLDERRAQQERERRAREEAERARAMAVLHRRRQRAFLVVSVFGIVLTALIALFAWHERNRAQRESLLHKEAEAQRIKAERALYSANIGLIERYIEELRYEWARERLAECNSEYRHWEWGRLQYLRNLDRMTVREHTAQVWDVDFSPDGTRFATAGEDAMAYVWNVADGRKTLTLEGHAQGVNSIAFSPDGRLIATGSQDGTLRIWDAKTGREIHRIAHDQWNSLWNSPVAFSPDGKYLAAAGEGATIKLWDVASSTVARTLPADRTNLESITFSPDGRILAATHDSTARLWDVQTGRAVRTLKGHEAIVTDVAFSPDGSRIATASNDETARIWDAATGEELHTLQGNAGRAFSVAFCPDGKVLATALDKKLIKLWDTETGAELRVLKGHEHGIREVAFSPDGRTLASASWDTTAKLWDVSTTPSGVAKTTSTVTVNTVSALDDALIVVAHRTAEDRAVFRDLVDGRERVALQGLPDRVNAFALSKDGRRLATGVGHNVILWDVRTGERISALNGHSLDVARVEFSPSGRFLASAARGGRVLIWDLQSGDAVTSISTDHLIPRGLSFSADETLLATMQQSASAKVWDVKSGKLVREFEGEFKGEASKGTWSVAFHPTRKLLAIGQFEGNAIIVDPVSGEEIVRCKGHTGPIYSVAFSPDGRRLVTGSWDQLAKIWDTKTGRELLTLGENSDWVVAVSFSRQGERLATVSRDGVATWWPAFSWEVDKYPGNDDLTVEDRLELYKRRYWNSRTKTTAAHSVPPSEE